MGEIKDATSNDTTTERVALAKIEPNKIDTTSPEIKSSNIEDGQVDVKIELEKSLISATILLLREYGIRKSGAAIRDAVEISHQFLGPKEAVSSLSSFGFKASFGNLNITKLSNEFFPLIAFDKNGKALVVLAAPVDSKISVIDPISRKKTDYIFSESALRMRVLFTEGG